MKTLYEIFIGVIVGLLIFTGLYVAIIFTPIEPTPTILTWPTHDQRYDKLTQFFINHECTNEVTSLIPDFIKSADQNGLDYSLLPSITVKESSCGKHYRYNNIFGWDSANSGFASIAEGLHFVADKLAHGKYYAGKTLDQKLHSYNSNPSYAVQIKGLMKELQ